MQKRPKPYSPFCQNKCSFYIVNLNLAKNILFEVCGRFNSMITYLYPQFLCELFRLYIHLLLALLSCGCFYFYRLKFTEFIYKSSNGDLICCKFLVLTCVYISVVLLLLCPNNSCIYLRSVPLSNRCVA